MDITVSFLIKDGTAVTEDQRGALLLLLNQASTPVADEEVELKLADHVSPEPDVDQPDVAYEKEPDEEVPGDPALRGSQPGSEFFESKHTLEDAVALATRLLSEGKTTAVRGVLRKLGAKRVSELSGEDLDSFMEQLA